MISSSQSRSKAEIRGIDRYRQTWPPFFDWLKTGGTLEIAWLDVTAGEDVAYAASLRANR